MKKFTDWLCERNLQEELDGTEDNSSFGGPRPGSPADDYAKKLRLRNEPGANTVGGKPGVTMTDKEYEEYLANKQPPIWKRLLGRAK